MKLIDLFEQQKVIRGHQILPYGKKELDYEGVTVMGDFSCRSTKIKSLKGAPNYVGGYFNCEDTRITSLEGAPEHVGGFFDCRHTKIKSLHNVHKQIKYIGRDFYISHTIKSHILGVMFIKGLLGIEFISGNVEQKYVEDIINKHLAGDHDPHTTQEELIDAGFSEYAKL